LRRLLSPRTTDTEVESLSAPGGERNKDKMPPKRQTAMYCKWEI